MQVSTTSPGPAAQAKHPRHQVRARGEAGESRQGHHTTRVVISSHSALPHHSHTTQTLHFLPPGWYFPMLGQLAALRRWPSGTSATSISTGSYATSLLHGAASTSLLPLSAQVRM